MASVPIDDLRVQLGEGAREGAQSVRGRDAERLSQCCLRIIAPGRDPVVEARAHVIGVGAVGEVRHIVEELADDLPSDLRVGATLDLDDCGDALIVNEDMIRRPELAARSLHGALTCDEDPAPCGEITRRGTTKQSTIAGEELLEDVLQDERT